MHETVLRTKLYIPRPQSSRILRPRLVAALNQGLVRGSQLTLLSAQAGSGKSSLIVEWLQSQNRPAAWFSADSSDADPRQFLTYLAAALQTITLTTIDGVVTNLGSELLARLQAPQPLPLGTLLTSLVNGLASVAEPFLMVIDDYHQIEAPAVDEILSFLLDHSPPTMHLVLSSREDPNVPLARLRVRGQLTELRTADLRFTQEETAQFLNQRLKLGLANTEIEALAVRTEGWAAGLQLAALALQRPLASSGGKHADFIRDFTGSHRFVLDYLFAEVLQRQPPSVQAFLLQTAVLDRLTGSLCDAVCFEDGLIPSGETNGRSRLRALEKENLFLIPLDSQRQWYRYHHLFADVLRAHLQDTTAFDTPLLHQRASDWYARHDLLAEAIHHALAASAYQQAAHLMEQAWAAMDGSFQSATWLTWVKKLPIGIVEKRPLLSTQLAWALLDVGSADEAEPHLQNGTRWLDAQEEKKAQSSNNDSEGLNDLTLAQQRQIPALIALGRAQQAMIRGDLASVAHFAENGRRLADDDPLRRAQAGALLGVSSWSRGDLEAAHQAMTDWVESMQQLGNLYFATASTFVLADIRTLQGRLHDARRTYEASLALIDAQDPDLRRVITHHYLGLALLAHEMGENDAATSWLGQAEALSSHSVLLDWPSRYQLALAQFRQAADDLVGALKHVEEAERIYVPNPTPDIRPIAAQKARLEIKLGNLVAAHTWATAADITLKTQVSFLQEYNLITLVRLHLAEMVSGQELAQGELTAVCHLLARLLTAAELGGRLGSVIEILLLQARAYQIDNSLKEAQAAMERALILGEPAGYFRLFVNEGVALRPLLARAQARGILPAFTERLMVAIEPNQADSPKAPQPLVDPLSRRELEVLRLLQTELTGPEIARELTVALSTVRTHTKAIYSKLAVSNRRAAVNRALKLNLI